MESTNYFRKLFDSLTVFVNQPWLDGSWEPYENFRKTFESHFVLPLSLCEKCPNR